MILHIQRTHWTLNRDSLMNETSTCKDFVNILSLKLVHSRIVSVVVRPFVSNVRSTV